MKTIRTLLVIAVLAAFSIPVFAGARVTTNPVAKRASIKLKKSGKVKMQRHAGILQAVNLNDRNLTVKSRRGEESFTILPETRVTRGREQLLQGDLKEGMKVTIGYKVENGEKIARSVRVAKG